jgi:uncharacterized tellurite resistance protein B-like protein
MELRLIEKMAMLKALAAVAYSDDEMNDAEIQLLTNIANNMDFDQDKVNAAYEMKPDEAGYVLNHMEEDKKKLFYDLIKETVFADDEANEKEVEFANNLLKAAGFNLE